MSSLLRMISVRRMDLNKQINFKDTSIKNILSRYSGNIEKEELGQGLTSGSSQGCMSEIRADVRIVDGGSVIYRHERKK